MMVEIRINQATEVNLIPLGTLHFKYDYRLVGTDLDTTSAKFNEVSIVVFVRRTHVALAMGAKVLIEDFIISDQIFICDPQPSANMLNRKHHIAQTWRLRPCRYHRWRLYLINVI